MKLIYPKEFKIRDVILKAGEEYRFGLGSSSIFGKFIEGFHYIMDVSRWGDVLYIRSPQISDQECTRDSEVQKSINKLISFLNGEEKE